MTGNRDSLTKLYDRGWMERLIGQELKAKGQIFVGILDLDFFSNMNEKIGGIAGDAVLKNVAELIPQRDNVTVGRYGSDEFIVLYRNMDKKTVSRYADELHRRFHEARLIGVKPYEKVRITFSMGIADASRVQTVFQVLKAAETALLTAKKNGRNRTEFLSGAAPHIIRLAKNSCITIVGNSLRGNCGEGQEAFDAPISEPYGLDIDRNHDILFADRSNHKIKLIQHGKIYTVAGIGSCGYGGDGGAAVSAKLYKPSGVCRGGRGDIYIADTGNHRIRMVRNGRITTIAGCGCCGFTGDGGTATTASLNRPGGVAVDARGNVYTNDYGNNVIRKIATNGTIITVAGNGDFGSGGDGKLAVNAALNKPYGLCVNDAFGILFIADYGNNRIRGVNLATGKIETVCGTGEAGYAGDGGDCLRAQINGPFWVCSHGDSLYIADANNHCIRKVDLNTKIITTVIGNGKPGYCDGTLPEFVQLRIPAGIAVQGRYLYIADYGNNAIRRAVLQ